MTAERTLSIIKPDATRRNLTGRINAMIEDAGLRIIAQKRVLWSRADAEAFYSYEGTYQMQNLIIGKAIAGLGAFV